MKKRFYPIVVLSLLASAPYAMAQEKPFILNGDVEYGTLQEAIDAIPQGSSGDITVKPCPSGIDGYDVSYATNISANITANGGEVFTRSKSLSIRGKNPSARPVLKDFVIVLESVSASKPDITISDMGFSGKSIIIVDNAHGGFGNIEVYGCRADVTNRTASFTTLKNKDNVGATYSSGTFMQWMQRSTGSTERLSVHDNEVVCRLSDPAGNIRIFNGGIMAKEATVKDNVFGSEAHPIENSSGWVMVSQCTAKDSRLEFCDNTVWQRGDCGLVWILATGVTATGLDVAVHDNSILRSDGRKPIFGADGDCLVYVPKNYTIGGKVALWRNYFNGYCFNEALNSIGDAVVIDKQIGHTAGDGHLHVMESDENILIRKYGVRRADIVHLEKADKFDGTTHDVIEFGKSGYCDRCGMILSAVTVSCSDLDAGESAFFEIADASGTPVITVALTGDGTGSVSKTVVGLEPGEYSVGAAQTDWSWTYSVPSSQRKTVKPLDKTAAQEEFTFGFTLVKKSGIEIKNAESAS